MSNELVSAFVAAIVSVVGILITILINRNTLKSEREKLEKELERNMTAKLYELRLQCYPEAIKFTEGLRRSNFNKQGSSISQDYFQGILLSLDDWFSTKAFLLLSQNSVKKYYELRDAFRDNPANGKKYSTEQLERVWNCKGSFRKSLKEDVQLLFNEESEIQEDD